MCCRLSSQRRHHLWEIKLTTWVSFDFCFLYFKPKSPWELLAVLLFSRGWAYYPDTRIFLSFYIFLIIFLNIHLLSCVSWVDPKSVTYWEVSTPGNNGCLFNSWFSYHTDRRPFCFIYQKIGTVSGDNYTLQGHFNTEMLSPWPMVLHVVMMIGETLKALWGGYTW